MIHTGSADAIAFCASWPPVREAVERGADGDAIVIRRPEGQGRAARERMMDRWGFTESEWSQLVDSPMLAAIAVTAAEPSGIVGLLKESLAVGEALAAAGSEPAGNALVRAVAEVYATPAGRGGAAEALRRHMQESAATDVKANAIAALAAVAVLVDRKAAADAPAFKAWLHSIGEKVALAAREGGFLGLAGVTLSAAERAALAEIGRALGLDA